MNCFKWHTIIAITAFRQRRKSRRIQAWSKSRNGIRLMHSETVLCRPCIAVTVIIFICCWSGIFVADILLWKKDYSEQDLFDSTGRYGSTNWKSIGTLVIASFIGFGFVTNSFATWLNWQGYFLNLIGGKSGTWAAANIGVVIALALGFFGRFIFGRKEILRQESF